MKSPEVSRQKRAELAATTGAGVLGAGLGALLATWAAPYALLLLALGVALHGWGMLERHRLEAGTELPSWSKVLYWMCWVLLGILVIWIFFGALR